MSRYQNDKRAARADGRGSFYAGHDRCNVPFCYAESPALIQHWQAGWDDGAREEAERTIQAERNDEYARLESMRDTVRTATTVEELREVLFYVLDAMSIKGPGL